MGEFGNKFRKAREKKQLSFEDVSSVLKISARMLQAIEAENFDLLPGGVFNKGFIRSYAKHLDLDPEDAVADYLATVRQAQISAEAALESTSAAPGHPGANLRFVESQRNSKSQAPMEEEELPDLQLPRAEHVRPGRKEHLERREGIPWSLIAAAVVVILLTILVWVRHSRGTRPAKPVPASTAVSRAAAPQVAPSSAAARQPEPPAPTRKESPQPAPMAPQPKSNVSPSHPVAASASAAAPSAQLLSLVIRASQNSWISVQADGRQVLEETMIAPARTAIGANKQIVVRVGNAAGISFLFNGVEVSPQGSESEVKTLVFDATGMKLPQ